MLERNTDYPGLFQAADLVSIRGQKTFLRAFGAKLVLGVLAATAAAFTARVGGMRVDIAAVITALAFFSALIVDLSMLRIGANRSWYEGRALAESAKTLAWRYAVGGSPFPHTLTDEQADHLFAERVRLLQRDLPSVRLLPTMAGPISARMRELRAAGFTERRRAYLEDRVLDQQRWYVRKATYHARRSAWLGAAVLFLESAGVIAALSRAFDVVEFDLAGIVAAAMAGFAAWSSARQHGATSTAYAVTSHELSVIGELLRTENDEGRWAAAVADAEDAISREHTLWRASHSG